MNEFKCTHCNALDNDPLPVNGCPVTASGYHEWVDADPEVEAPEPYAHCIQHPTVKFDCLACCAANGWATRKGVPEVKQIAAFQEQYGQIGTWINQYMSISQLQARIHQQNKDMGWWDNPREMGTLLCLVHSEISEAMEGERKNLMDDHLPARSMLEVELADAMIRIMDIAASRGLDLAGAIVEKVEYNRTRADHQPGARAETYGKKF